MHTLSAPSPAAQRTRTFELALRLLLLETSHRMLPGVAVSSLVDRHDNEAEPWFGFRPVSSANMVRLGMLVTPLANDDDAEAISTTSINHIMNKIVGPGREILEVVHNHSLGAPLRHARRKLGFKPFAGLAKLVTKHPLVVAAKKGIDSVLCKGLQEASKMVEAMVDVFTEGLLQPLVEDSCSALQFFVLEKLQEMGEICLIPDGDDGGCAIDLAEILGLEMQDIPALGMKIDGQQVLTVSAGMEFNACMEVVSAEIDCRALGAFVKQEARAFLTEVVLDPIKGFGEDLGVCRSGRRLADNSQTFTIIQSIAVAALKDVSGEGHRRLHEAHKDPILRDKLMMDAVKRGEQMIRDKLADAAAARFRDVGRRKLSHKLHSTPHASIGSGEPQAHKDPIHRALSNIGNEAVVYEGGKCYHSPQCKASGTRATVCEGYRAGVQWGTCVVKLTSTRSWNDRKCKHAGGYRIGRPTRDISIEQCASRCRDNLDCVAFSFGDGFHAGASYNERWCALCNVVEPLDSHTGITTYEIDGYGHFSFSVSFSFFSFSWSMANRKCKSGDRIGSPTKDISIGQCASRCDDDAGCMAFSFGDGSHAGAGDGKRWCALCNVVEPLDPHTGIHTYVRSVTGTGAIDFGQLVTKFRLEASVTVRANASIALDETRELDLIEHLSGKKARYSQGSQFQVVPMLLGFAVNPTFEMGLPLKMRASFQGAAVIEGRVGYHRSWTITMAATGASVAEEVQEGDGITLTAEGQVSASLSVSVGAYVSINLRLEAIIASVVTIFAEADAKWEAKVGGDLAACGYVSTEGSVNPCSGLRTQLTDYIEYKPSEVALANTNTGNFYGLYAQMGVWVYVPYPAVSFSFGTTFPGSEAVTACLGVPLDIEWNSNFGSPDGKLGEAHPNGNYIYRNAHAVSIAHTLDGFPHLDLE